MGGDVSRLGTRSLPPFKVGEVIDLVVAPLSGGAPTLPLAPRNAQPPRLPACCRPRPGPQQSTWKSEMENLITVQQSTGLVEMSAPAWTSGREKGWRGNFKTFPQLWILAEPATLENWGLGDPS